MPSYPVASREMSRRLTVLMDGPTVEDALASALTWLGVPRDRARAEPQLQKLREAAAKPARTGKPDG